MRSKLKSRILEYDNFIGEYNSTYKIFNNNKVIFTILLHNITTVDGEFICSHMWINKTKLFNSALNLKKHDLIMFTARIVEYKKKKYDRVDDGVSKYYFVKDYKFDKVKNIIKIN